MSSSIQVYGQNQSQLDWMKSNYTRADQRFQIIHPDFHLEGEIMRHGIIEMGDAREREQKFTYYWNIPCHWDSEMHFMQTERDIRSVLHELHGPKGIDVHLSPMAD